MDRFSGDPEPTPTMGMTRRDVDDLYKTSVRDVESYLSKESGKRSHTSSPMQYVLETLASISGAAAGGYLAGWRGTIVPALALGAIGHGLAYADVLGFASPLHTFSNGALDAAIGIWAAGKGALMAEKPGPGGVTTAGTLPEQQQQPRPQGPLTDADLQAIAASRYGR